MLILCTFFACSSPEFFNIEGKKRDKVAFHEGQISDEVAYSGKQSVIVDAANPYGLSCAIEKIKKNQTYTVSVKRYKNSEGTGALIAESPNIFYHKTTLAQPIADNDAWETLELSFEIPYDAHHKLLKIYVWSPDGEQIYFDDLQVKVTSPKGKKSFIPAKIELPKLNISLPEQSMARIEEVRKEAMEKGLLINQDDHWVTGFLLEKQDSIPVKMRLKGDWTDHLSGKQWSFRIKTKKGFTWNRMRTFSIQHPKTRNYLHEWLYHEMLKDENVLTPRYQFIEVSINGQEPYIYALEEHFDKQLIEYNERREGPIVKFSEDGFWETMHRSQSLITEQPKSVAYYEMAPVDVFKEKRTLASPTLRQQYENARTLMQQYKDDSQNFSTIFDIDLMAKFLAITDIHRAYHSTRWHNQRFYYNPVSAVLEPIGFDGFGEEIMTLPQPFLGYKHIKDSTRTKGEDDLLTPFFDDPILFKKYIHYLKQYTDENYINRFLESRYEQIKGYANALPEGNTKEEYTKSIIKQAEKIRLIIQPFEHNSLQANLVTATESKTTLQLKNFHSLPLEIIGIGSNKIKPDALFVNAPLLYTQPKKEFTEITVKGVGKYLFCKALGMDSTLVVTIAPLARSKETHPRQNLLAQSNLKNFPFIVEKGETLYFKEGSYIIKAPIVIPPNKKVVIPQNTQLDFINKSFFISYSPIQMQGNSDAPILIKSSDKSAQAFTLLQAKEKSELKYVVFDGFNTLNYEGWLLTGAVNFYESDVDLYHCSFINNQCEDALNIIRSKFHMDGCLVNNTFADGFDGDFCEGTILNSRITNTGNDGLDFSGSDITIENCTLLNNGDKGISVGENSKASIKDCTITDAATGVAAKDLSKVTIESIVLKDIGKGFSAFQKKSEYGGANIIVRSYKAENVVKLSETDEGSIIEIEE